MSIESELVLAAARLARNAPKEWDSFMEQLRAYSTDTMKQCIQSPLPELPRSQGHAQGIARFTVMMDECRASAAKIESKRK